MQYSKVEVTDTVSMMEEREELTTLLDDVAKLHEVAETLPAGDERAQALESVASRRRALAPGKRPSLAHKCSPTLRDVAAWP